MGGIRIPFQRGIAYNKITFAVGPFDGCFQAANPRSLWASAAAKQNSIEDREIQNRGRKPGK